MNTLGRLNVQQEHQTLQFKVDESRNMESYS
jgi:hypothetical protein